MKHLLLFVLTLVPFVPVRAGFTNGQPADLLLGVPARPQMNPIGVAVDPLTQKVFVADLSGSRILRYSSAGALENDSLPEASLGQPDLYSRSKRSGPAGLNEMGGIAVDSAGRLWVADKGNHRVLRFDNASSLATGAAASGVLGQANLNTSIAGTAENRLTSPQGVAVDTAGRLWLADTGNNRVLRWNNAATRPSGAFADAVLGQSTYAGNAGGTSAAGMAAPSGLALEYAGGALVRLWVSDFANHRVLGFNSPATKPNGGVADKLFGSSTFGPVTLAMPPQRGTFGEPYGLAMDNADLWIADSSYHRVVRYANAGAKSNGAGADSLLGQFNFGERAQGTGLADLNTPFAVAVSGGRLWIAEYGNRRLVRHEGAALKNGLEPADGTLGQSPAPPNTELSVPRGAAIDPTSGKLFVCDLLKHRVVRYPSARSLETGGQPEAVFGQPNFSTITPGLTAAKMDTPEGLTVDILGNLWVADTGNNRVLRFAGAATLASGSAAVQVLGKANFTTGGSGLGAAFMNEPTGLATEWGFNASFAIVVRRLWVADSANHRVLRFDSPLTLGNGSAASGVLGQTALNAGTAATTATGMKRPVGLASEGGGRLWVADSLNERILRFDSASLKTNGAPADGVLLQTLFTTATYAGTPNQLCVSPGGRLFVPMRGSHRLLWLDNAATKPNGGAPDGVLGQPDFTTSGFSGGFSGMWNPLCATLDPLSGRLWVVNGGTAEIQRFTPSLESHITGYGFNPEGRFTLTINGRSGEYFEIRSSTDLQAWPAIERTDNVPGSGWQTLTWTAPGAPAGPKKFYRLQVP